MMLARFADNPDYVEHEARLRELHRLIAIGQEESSEADAIYEALDRTWRGLDRGEMDRLSGLSADLYMLQGQEICEPLGEGLTVGERNRLLGEAVAQQDWEQFLRLLRKGESPFEASVLAFLRGSAYGALGHDATGLVFLRHARALDPGNEQHRAVLLDQLTLQDDLAEAVAEADLVLAEATPSAALRLQAGTIVLLSARSIPSTKRRPVFERAASVLRHALDDAAADQQRDLFVASGWVTLGRCYAMLGLSNDARSAYDTAMDIVPGYAEALVERAYLRERNDPAGALQDFQAAIKALAPRLHIEFDSIRTGAAGTESFGSALAVHVDRKHIIVEECVSRLPIGDGASQLAAA